MAAWHEKGKDWASAESTLAEAISLAGPYAYHHQLKLIELYLNIDQPRKAEQIMSQATDSKYADSKIEFLRARWLRTMGKEKEAMEVEGKARTQKLKEEKQLEATQ